MESGQVLNGLGHLASMEGSKIESPQEIKSKRQRREVLKNETKLPLEARVLPTKLPKIRPKKSTSLKEEKPELIPNTIFKMT